jgi:catechol 2,3-dioxygenase-like lactoylglutathione lyase family enzyme
MLDHVAFRVGDFPVSKAFFDAALKPLGVSALVGGDGHAGYGADGNAFFWIGTGDGAGAAHVAFAAPDRSAVDAFYAAAMAAGGRDNGPPGVRANYDPDYYGAFVLDPDGHNVEAVCRKAP